MPLCSEFGAKLTKATRTQLIPDSRRARTLQPIGGRSPGLPGPFFT
jgi:hypothetical protein